MVASAGKGHTTNIICTQPRRISAIGVAERVARYVSVCVGVDGVWCCKGRAPDIAARISFHLLNDHTSERAEDIGETVGYQIRLEKMAEDANTKLLFCTTGKRGVCCVLS